MILVYKKNGYEYRLFLLLNFLRAAILNIYDVNGCPIVAYKRTSILNNSGNHMTS